MNRFAPLLVLVIVLAAVLPASAAINPGQLDWSVQYLIDTSQTVFGNSQSPSPRDNRGLAISPDGQYMYLGYNNSYSTGEVRKIDLSETDCVDASVAQLTGVRGKSIAVDDAGRVFLAEGSSIKVYDADLTTLQYSIATTKCEGVAVARDAGTLYLYGTDRTNANLTKWALAESGGAITGGSVAWQTAITGASNLRGCEVDASGRIWMADIDANKVFRVDGDGSDLAWVDVSSPMDIAFDGSSAWVTQYTDRTISVLDADMDLLGSPISMPWLALELDADGQSGGGALSGIAIVPGRGVYVTNETGQTADEKSTYGRTDANSGELGGKFYTDLHSDDNDPVLFAAVPEPSTLALLLGGATMLVWAARRRR